MRKRALEVGRRLTREARAIAKQGQLILSAPRRPAAKQHGGVDVADGAERVVLFVHGFMAAGPVFEPLRARVERELALQTVDLTYPPLSEFEVTAERVAQEVRSLAKTGRKVSIVAHSLGGLLTRWSLQELGSHAHVDRLVMLATPHAGTQSARFAPGPLGVALRPGSAIVQRLKDRREQARDVRHVAIVAGVDWMVTPPSSAAAIDNAEIVWFRHLGHNELLFDMAVHNVVLRALR